LQAIPPRGNQQECEENFSTPFSAKVKNKCSRNSPPPYALIVCTGIYLPSSLFNKTEKDVAYNVTQHTQFPHTFFTVY